MPKPKNDAKILAHIGARLQAAREARGLTQADLGERIGIESVTLSRYETGARGASLTVLARAADELGVTLADLVGDRPVPEPDRDPRVLRALDVLCGLDEHHLDLAVGVLTEIGRVSKVNGDRSLSSRRRTPSR
jgi:transcriptional regulator with XRE-family HTH domain